MNDRRVRRAALGIFLCAGLLAGRAAQSRSRLAASVATPPAAAKNVTPAPRLSNPEWVDITVAAKRLGLKITWLVPAREAVLSDRDTRLEVASDRIEVRLDGERIFLGQALLSRGGNLFVSKIDLDHCLVPLIKPGLLGTPKSAPKIIVLDPGHGGPDDGKINEQLKLYEKTLTLDTVLRLKKILDARGWKVVLTRGDDRQLKPGKQEDLQRRAQIADEAGADVFVSIHFNAVADQVEKVNGVEVYRFTPQHQAPVTRSLRRLDDELANPGNTNDAWNSILAHTMQRTLLRELKLDDRGFKHDRLAVLRLVSCPAVLIEGGFLSNTAEAKKIATASYRQQLAQAVADGLGIYAAQLESLRAAAKPPAS